MTLAEFRELLAGLVGRGDRPVVVFSATWPLQRVLEVPRAELIGRVLDTLIDVTGPERSLFLPAFSKGLQNGFADLDADASFAGAMTEMFRQRPGVRRTVCPWFSFSVLGPDSAEVVGLRPRHAWGEGSLFEWMEQRDALFLMIGTDPSHCSYLHRIEWLERAVVKYRYDKPFQGRVRHEGREFDIATTLFVRLLDPDVVMNFAPVVPALVAGGMTVASAGGVPIAAMGARQMLAAFAPVLRADPLVAVANRDEVARAVALGGGPLQ